MTDLFDPLHFKSGATMKNRFMLAPLTNTQSHDDGTLSDEEYHWLTLRAQGGFGATMTCASFIDPAGKGFPGQLGCASDDHLPGLKRLAAGIQQHDSLALVQLHHAGMRSPKDLIGQQPVCPSDNEEYGARALTTDEVEQAIENFIAGAIRAEQAGFDGVEVHGAHGYLLCEFLSPTINQRQDQYGGSLANRARIILDIIKGIRQRCRPDFILGVRLSPERFDVKLPEIRELAQQLLQDNRIDFLDMSLWDVFKEPKEDEYKGRPLISYFTDLNRGDVKLGVAGKIGDGAIAQQCLDEGVDFVLPGRGAILHHDLPNQIKTDRDFTPVPIPVSAEYLRTQGLSPNFLKYMANFPGFIETQE